jgi:RNA polymerase sigma factor (TIGR02999 family)
VGWRAVRSDGRLAIGAISFFKLWRDAAATYERNPRATHHAFADSWRATQPRLKKKSALALPCPLWRNDCGTAIMDLMSEVTQLLNAIDQGDPQAAEQLLPLVYAELRQLAAQKLSHEKPGQTLQATALVHEAYLRLAGAEQKPQWDNRRHFFAAAAEAMRRILIEAARRKGRLKNENDRVRLEFSEADFVMAEKSQDLLALDEALDRLAATDARAAELIKLRYFTGFTNAEAASLLEISPRKATQIWAYARAWLLEELGQVQ